MAQIYQPAVSAMLELHFVNVGDGDCTLVEERRDGSVFRLLVDTGRPELAEEPGSLRQTAAQYLESRGISRVDALVITHLHMDHFGDLRPLLGRVAFSDVYAGFFPEGPVALDRTALADLKTVRGLADHLERWAEDVERLRELGCRLHPVTETLSVAFTDALSGQIVCRDSAASAYQRAAWTALLAGRPVPEGLQYWSSKYRNSGSLRLRLGYAGRTVELAGDCYGAAWENEAEPCDILKVPHHADAKSLTPALVSRLRPSWAVVSCGARYIEKKDRPSRAAVELLERQGARVFFTDSFSAPWHAPVRWRAVDITISDDGAVSVPGRLT